jgi:hypothetical protein
VEEAEEVEEVEEVDENGTKMMWHMYKHATQDAIF